MPKKKPLWHDPSIEWFYVGETPLPPAINGGFESRSRVDHDDSVEIRRCTQAFRKALETCDRSDRYIKRWGMRNSTIDLECLARDPCFFHLHDRSFWPTRIGYRVSRPEQMSHHFSVPVSYCVTRHTKDNEELRRNTFPGGMVVSEELRQIIEKLQPGYAKFFPVQLEFKDCVADGYSWFIQPYRLVETETFLGGRLGDYVRSLPDAAGDYTVEAPRSKLAGVHWERTDSLKYFFSGEMVRRLEPLILRRENAWLKSLVPVTVIED